MVYHVSILIPRVVIRIILVYPFNKLANIIQKCLCIWTPIKISITTLLGKASMVVVAHNVAYSNCLSLKGGSPSSSQMHNDTKRIHIFLSKFAGMKDFRCNKG